MFFSFFSFFFEGMMAVAVAGNGILTSTAAFVSPKAAVLMDLW